MIQRFAEPPSSSDLELAIASVLEELGENVSVGEFVEALTLGDSQRAIQAATSGGVSQSAIDRLTDALTGTRVALVGRFDLVLDDAVAWARTQSATLITNVSAGQQKAVAELVATAIEEKVNPRSLQSSIRDAVGLTRPQARSLAKYAAILQASELPKGNVDRALSVYAARLSKQRAETIARTETIASSNGGLLDAWKRRRDSGLVAIDARKRWVVTPDDRLCLTYCAPMARQERLLDESFQTGTGSLVLHPPAHPRCRCAMVLAK